MWFFFYLTAKLLAGAAWTDVGAQRGAFTDSMYD